MDLKENFHQAFRELLYGRGPGDSNTDDKKKLGSLADSNFEISRADAQDITEPIENDFADSNVKSGNGSNGVTNFKADSSTNVENAAADRDELEQSTQNRQNGIFGRRGQPNRFTPNIQAGSSSSFDDFSQPSPLIPQVIEEMTVISKNTVVVGSIQSLANVTIDGNVRGKVNVLKNATLSGALVGDLVCNNFAMQGSSVEGNVLAKNSSYLDNDSILLGNLKAHDSSIDGKVKGDIDVGSKIVLHKNSIVAGNINTDSIMVEDGANIKGFVNTAFFAEHGDSAFPSKVILGNEEQNSND